jgi:hypothetical protein
MSGGIMVSRAVFEAAGKLENEGLAHPHMTAVQIAGTQIEACAAAGDREGMHFWAEVHGCLMVRHFGGRTGMIED